MLRVFPLLLLALLAMAPLAAADVGVSSQESSHCETAYVPDDGRPTADTTCTQGTPDGESMRAKEKGNQVKCGNNIGLRQCSADSNTSVGDINGDGNPDSINSSAIADARYGGMQFAAGGMKGSASGAPGLAIGDPGCNCRFVAADPAAGASLETPGARPFSAGGGASAGMTSVDGQPDSFDVGAAVSGADHGAAASTSGGKKGLNAVNVKLA